jgi:hypothetical protein
LITYFPLFVDALITPFRGAWQQQKFDAFYLHTPCLNSAGMKIARQVEARTTVTTKTPDKEKKQAR